MSARIEALARARAEALAETLAVRLEEAVPGVAVARAGEVVTVSGRGVARRALTDPALRWPGGLLR